MRVYADVHVQKKDEQKAIISFALFFFLRIRAYSGGISLQPASGSILVALLCS